MSKQFTHIFTHADCSDGALALWIAQHRSPGAEIQKIKAGAAVPDLHYGHLSGKRVLFLDTVPSNIEQIVNNAEFVLVIDHHLHPNKAVLDELKESYKEYLEVVFDEKKCASELTWEHFQSGSYPWFLQVVACNDCWRWETAPPHFKPLWRSLFQGNMNVDFKALECFDADQINSAILKGVKLLEEDEVKIEKHVSQATHHEFTQGDCTYFVLLLKDCDPSLVSVVGNRLAQNCAFAAIATQEEKTWSISLRSSQSGWANVGQIASSLAKDHPDKVIKGGGHPNAAGITLKCELEQVFQPIL